MDGGGARDGACREESGSICRNLLCKNRAHRLTSLLIGFRSGRHGVMITYGRSEGIQYLL